MEKETKINTENDNVGLSLTALILGIIAVFTSFIPILNNLSFFIAIIGGVLGIIALIKKQKKVMSIISIIIAVLAIVFTVWAQASLSKSIDEIFDDFDKEMEDIFADKTDEILKNELDVVLGEFVITEDEYFTDTEMEVTLTNKSNERKSFSVQVDAIDAEGNRIEEDTAYANNLGPGQKVTDKIFNFVQEEKINQLRSAKFEIVEVSSY